MKFLAKKLMYDQQMAEQLFAISNYDGMYLAGMIAKVSDMTKDDFNRWMDSK